MPRTYRQPRPVGEMANAVDQTWRGVSLLDSFFLVRPEMESKSLAFHEASNLEEEQKW